MRKTKQIKKIYPGSQTEVTGAPPLTFDKSNAKDLPDYQIYGESKQDVLPSGYTQVEYLESSGTQYIDTGFTPNSNTKIDVNISDITTPNSDGDYSICGSRNVASAGSGFALMANKTSDGIKLRSDYFGDVSYSSDYLSSNTIYNVVKDKNLFYIDESLIATQPTSTDTTNYNLYLFNLNNAGSITSSVITTIKIYSTKIYDNGTLVRNFIPAIRNSDSVAGMYDTVTGNFYTNAGTGTFTVGANTPTLDVPIPVLSLGENSKNLFDGSYIVGWVSASSIKPGNGDRTVYIKCNPNTTYVLSKTAGGGRFRAGTTNVLPVINATVSDYISAVDNATTLTITTGSSANYLVAYVYDSAVATVTFQEILNSLQIQQGSTATEYKPHNYIDAGISGKNVIPMNGGNYVLGSFLILYSKQNPNIPAGTYTVSCKIDSSNLSTEAGAYIRAFLYNADNSVTARSGNSITGGNIGYSQITFEYDGINDILFDMTRSGSVKGDTAIVSEPMLELGSERTTYEPYQTPISTTITLDEPLRKIGTYADYVDYGNQKIVRNIGKYEFVGNETFAVYTGYYERGIVGRKPATPTLLRCSHLKNGSSQGCISGSASTNNVWYFVTTEFPTQAEWQAFLLAQATAGTPVIVYYVLATPTETPYTLPSISTFKWTNIITATDDNLDASNLDITYYKK